MDKTKPCYLFFDYDGTVYVDRIIPDATLNAMLAAQRMGHKLIMNTGRSWGEAAYNKLAFTVVPWDGTVNGGGDIRFEGKMLVEHTVPTEEAHKWLDYAMEKRATFIVGGQKKRVDFDLSDHPEPFTEEERQKLYAEVDAVMEWNPPTKLTLLPGLDLSDAPESALTVIGMDHYVDLFSVGCDKGTTIHEFCKATGAEMEQCICFGDSENDVEMFRVCPTSIAMAHAPKCLTELATYHAKSDLGVVEGLSWLFGIEV